MSSRIGKVTALAAAGLLMSAAPAFAHGSDDGAIDNAQATHGHDQHHQHGGDEGHLPAVSKNVGVVSKLALKNVEPGKIADVSVLGNYAYLAAWGGQTCTNNGVHVVDISNVGSPREVAFIKAKEGSYPGEGVQAVAISTPAFTGDLLVTNNEICKDPAGVGGMNIYDVSNPTKPLPLAVGFGDMGGGQSSSPRMPSTACSHGTPATRPTRSWSTTTRPKTSTSSTSPILANRPSSPNTT